MTTGMTLFGGLIAIMIVFLLLRAMKVSAELAGLISAGIPLLIYIASLFGQWPGLDVVAIHIAVFIVTAFVLVMFARNRAKSSVGGQIAGKQAMHWAPKALIIFFVLLALMNASLLYISTNGLPAGLANLVLPGEQTTRLHTGFSGTTRHGQDAAKAVGADLSRQHRNQQLGWQVRLEGLRSPAVGAHTLYVYAEDRDGRTLADLAGVIRVARPGDKGVMVPLVATPANPYQARIEFPASGLWVVELKLGAYQQSWEINVPEQDAGTQSGMELAQ